MARRVTREEGILAGESTGTAVLAALDEARLLMAEDPARAREAVFVVILPDGGKNYMSKLYNDEWMRANGLLATTGAVIRIDELLAVRQRGPELPAVVLARTTERVGSAIETLQEYGISQLPVSEDADGQAVAGIVGSISEKALLERAYRDPSIVDRTVGEVMESPLPLVDASATLDEAFALLSEGAPAVVAVAGERPAGVVTKLDLLEYLSHRRNWGRHAAREGSGGDGLAVSSSAFRRAFMNASMPSQTTTAPIANAVTITVGCSQPPPVARLSASTSAGLNSCPVESQSAGTAARLRTALTAARGYVHRPGGRRRREDDLESGDDEEVRQPEGPQRRIKDRHLRPVDGRRSHLLPDTKAIQEPFPGEAAAGRRGTEGRTTEASEPSPAPGRRQRWPRTGPILQLIAAEPRARSIASSSWRERSRATPPESVRLTALPARAPSLRGAASAVETVSAIAACEQECADRARTKRWPRHVGVLSRCVDAGIRECHGRSMGGART